jgi:hypothetical protein
MRLFNVRRSTLILTFGILALFVLLNVPGEFVSPGGGSFGPAYPAEYAHGWPWVWLHREVDYQNPIHIPESPLGLSWLAWSNWRFWQGNALWHFRLGAFAGNVVVPMLVILAIGSAWEWRRRRAKGFRFSLAECMLGFVLVAAPLGWGWHVKNVASVEKAVADSLEKFGFVSQEYHGPLWFKRLVGTRILDPAFMRIDSASISVDGDDEFQTAVTALQKLSYLRELSIEKRVDASSVSYSELAKLKGLRHLTLDHIVINEEDIAELAELRQLAEIDIGDWRWQKPEIMQRLLGALPGCRISEEPIYYQSTYETEDRSSN